MAASKIAYYILYRLLGEVQTVELYVWVHSIHKTVGFVNVCEATADADRSHNNDNMTSMSRLH